MTSQRITGSHEDSDQMLGFSRFPAKQMVGQTSRAIIRPFIV